MLRHHGCFDARLARVLPATWGRLARRSPSWSLGPVGDPPRISTVPVGYSGTQESCLSWVDSNMQLSNMQGYQQPSQQLARVSDTHVGQNAVG